MHYILTVSEINKYIKEIISNDLVLSNLWVKGEISNYKHHYSGHMYFTVKDDSCLIKCVMFKTHAQNLKFLPENGMKVIIKGYVSVFERDGQYQLYAEEMQPDGLGNLHLAFEQLKRKLQEEGLFDEKHKKRIPYLPKSIAVVTSSTGAVIRDILNVVNRRFQNVHIRIFPVAVQGETASLQVARAIGRINELRCADVIIVARGGGSLEELWAFNEEIVARSIFQSQIPVVSAIGHETDYTIADFAADLRAPTPSAAAEMVVPEKEVLVYKILSLQSRLKNSLQHCLNSKKSKFEHLMSSSVFRQPFDRIYQGRMRLDIFNKYLLKGIQSNIIKDRSKLCALLGKLDALSPLTVLARGYSTVKSHKNGRLIRSVEDVVPGDEIDVTLKDGMLDCIVQTAKKDGDYEEE